MLDRHPRNVAVVCVGLAFAAAVLALDTSVARACECATFMDVARFERIARQQDEGWSFVLLEVTGPPCDGTRCAQAARVVAMCGDAGVVPERVTIETVEGDCSPRSVARGRWAIEARNVRGADGTIIGFQVGNCPVVLQESEFREMCEGVGGSFPVHRAGCASCSSPGGLPGGIASLAFVALLLSVLAARRGMSHAPESRALVFRRRCDGGHE